MTQPEIIISTDAVEPCLRNDFWREVTSPIFDTTPVDGTTNTPLFGTIRSRPVGGLLIGTVSFNAQRYRRDRRVIAQGGLDHHLIQILTAGTMRGTFGRRSVTAEPGDICIMDFTQTFESRADTGARMTMAVPRKDLENALGRRNLHGAVLKAGAPMTQLLVDFLQGLRAVSARLSASEAFAAQDAMVSLLAAGLTGQDITGHVTPSALNDALRERVIEFIDANLTCPELGPGLLMRRFRISRAHLYRAFADDGGVGTLIRNKRLDAAYLALTHQHGRERSITEIATDCGFSSSAQFLRAFRSHFGLTPSDAKREGVMPAAALGEGSHSLQRHFAHYRSAPDTESHARD
ncbi:helix-turn-helix domain-containing protein [Burkholderia sp. Bp8963]|uniref:AraC-like ligand-binding domain-containing protein n=1 Tax=Burkholderia sp. Bp8963 TaxID=2184547 RepID=UPI000F5A1406|nr:helix-turn-helix domain-containing protein [Burkholderia sp. Bp8963]RQS68456.1 helix-turn-helix domain-containing protein [Burkholderia sp. Bp8963]